MECIPFTDLSPNDIPLCGVDEDEGSMSKENHVLYAYDTIMFTQFIELHVVLLRYTSHVLATTAELLEIQNIEASKIIISL